MRICILALNRSREGSERLYNAQDIGLGKAFAELGHETNVIHFEKRESPNAIEKYSDLLTISHFNVFAIGGNSIGIKKFLPIDADVMICFSDVQVSFSLVYRHCKKNNIVLIPYIGVIESHSTNPIKKMLMRVIELRNMNLYRTLFVCAKTESLKKDLLRKKVKNVVVAPVCLDKDRLVSDISNELRETLRMSIIPSYSKFSKVIIFVGRFAGEKRPLDALDLFYNLYRKDASYRLIMIGSGVLKKNVVNFIANRKIDNVVALQETVLNKDMWKYYVSADCLLNLNRVEIFGMSILEAMYYECPVVAYAASGPKMIISDRLDGYLFENDMDAEKLIDLAISKGRLKKAKETVESKYTWTITANKMLQLVRDKL